MLTYEMKIMCKVTLLILTLTIMTESVMCDTSIVYDLCYKCKPSDTGGYSCPNGLVVSCSEISYSDESVSILSDINCPVCDTGHSSSDLDMQFFNKSPSEEVQMNVIDHGNDNVTMSCIVDPSVMTFMSGLATCYWWEAMSSAIHPTHNMSPWLIKGYDHWWPWLRFMAMIMNNRQFHLVPK